MDRELGKSAKGEDALPGRFACPEIGLRGLKPLRLENLEVRGPEGDSCGKERCLERPIVGEVQHANPKLCDLLRNRGLAQLLLSELEWHGSCTKGEVPQLRDQCFETGSYSGAVRQLGPPLSIHS